ncbi:hypothetical protein BpHYR1_019885 [Brachionus plicatilis]|uniref:Uncharacterized protein n=1 Tax=Brachionus plicatilis TaxID=10195 RepID=A0A3M7T8W5_BRAPC|nr:hypothetical protein BpHYR1_019885 [Brachionus plicatilis]
MTNLRYSKENADPQEKLFLIIEAKKLNKKWNKVTIISDEEDELESEIEISSLNDQKNCFKCKTMFGKVKISKS